MKIKYFIVLLLVVTFTPKTKCGFLSDMLGGFFGGIVDGATKGMIDNAKKAFRESMDYLFDNKIQPMIHQLEATADRVLDRARDDINAVIDNFKKQMEELNKFEDKLFQDMTVVLNKIDEMLKEVSCFAQAIVYRVTDEIKKALPSIPNPWEECRIILDDLFKGENMRWKLVSSFTPSQLYAYRKCRLTHYLNETSPIEAVKMAYRDLELLAGDMRCLSVSLGAIQNEKYYIKEMGEADYILDTLNKVSRKSLKSENSSLEQVVNEKEVLNFLEN